MNTFMAPYAGVDQTEGREVLLRCRQSLANQAEGQQIRKPPIKDDLLI